MPGQHIARLAERVLRDETFLLVVSPAIADFQLEADSGSLRVIARGYLSIARAMCGALFQDLSTDLVVLSDDVPDLIRVLALQVCYYTVMLTLIGGAAFRTLPRDAFVLLATLVVTLSVIPTLVCFWPERFSATDLTD